MSFMNPVDMVEEDAADLQFPKVKLEVPNSLSKISANQQQRITKVRPQTETKYATTYYNAEEFNRTLEQRTKALQQYNADYNVASVHNVERCSTCNCDLYEPYIKCPDCEYTLLCMQCFAQGRETATHLNTHSYIIVRDDIQVFPGANNWTARDERILLHTLEKKGYGNWEAVTQALHFRHSADECRLHYHNYYFGGIFERLLGLTHSKNAYFPERMPYVVKMRSVDPPRSDEPGTMQFKMMAGYRCARGDFDTAYDNSAEDLLTTIMQDTFATNAATDDYEEMLDENSRNVYEEMQLAVVRAYNHRLRERQRRYKIMRDHGLIMPNRTLGWISKYGEALGSESNCSRFLSFMQICNPIKFDMLVESLKYFTDTQKTIYRLYELRQNGVRTLAGGSLYFKLKKRRAQQQRDRLKDDNYRQLHDWRKLIPSAQTLVPNPFATANVVSNPRRKAGPMDIIGMPGYTRLTDGERKLCSVERIAPQAYIDYKNILIAENMKMGHLRLADARRLIKIDVNKTRQIYDFLIENGHINRPL
ncbi:transcriptional adapter 2A isoform X1 [Zeugodacus cucurbitae]|uniref:transcriptional adapter 2A isoform X1 n=1 Tax=Zeugodacus cucurbitae TaxID=28588 RepID=UPI0023D91A7C|nr:transcriptional adapter 2A isoform X1 [Zeugodacus cucurbitae]